MSRLFFSLAAGLAFGVGNIAIASPIFVIDSGLEWQAALDDGRIVAISNYADIEDGFPGRSSDFVVPTLSVEGDSLVYDFGSNSNAVGGIQYIYPVDPDLNGLNVSYHADPGASVRFVIQLVDFDPSRPEHLQKTHKTFRFTAPSSGASVNLNFPAAATDPASVGADSIGTSTGFRLSHVTSIYYYSADGFKNILNEINMVPEPSGMFFAGLIGLSLLTWTGYRRRPKHQACRTSCGTEKLVT
jgi:hypothetical protein